MPEDNLIVDAADRLLRRSRCSSRRRWNKTMRVSSSTGELHCKIVLERPE